MLPVGIVMSIPSSTVVPPNDLRSPVTETAGGGAWFAPWFVMRPWSEPDAGQGQGQAGPLVFQGGCPLRSAQVVGTHRRSVRSLSLVWSVPSRAGSTAAVVRRPVAGVGGARHPASLRAWRRGQPDRREGPAGRGGCHRRWSRALRAAHRRRQL